MIGYPDYPEWNITEDHHHTMWADRKYCWRSDQLIEIDPEDNTFVLSAHDVGQEILTTLPEFLILERL